MLCRFFKGGITFEYIDNLPIPDIINLNNTAVKISEKEKKEMDSQNGN